MSTKYRIYHIDKNFEFSPERFEISESKQAHGWSQVFQDCLGSSRVVIRVERVEEIPQSEWKD
jgi:hypothetical protein